MRQPGMAYVERGLENKYWASLNGVMSDPFGKPANNRIRGVGLNDGDLELVASMEELDEALPYCVQLSTGEQVCLVRLSNEVFGISEECPHGEFSMSDGAVVDDYVIECGMHGSQFDLRDGSVIESPAREPVHSYFVKLVGNEVWVRRERE